MTPAESALFAFCTGWLLGLGLGLLANPGREANREEEETDK